MKCIVCLAAALMALAAPALAQDRCGPPPAGPVIPDGKTATQEQMNSARADATLFMKTSDEWQFCMQTDLDKQKNAAKGSRTPFDPKIEAGIVAKGDANQKDKVRVGTEYAAAAKAYLAAHPKN